MQNSRLRLLSVSKLLTATFTLAAAPQTLGQAGEPPADGGQRRLPLVGAIRWDAWTGGGVTEQVERTLGPRQYHFRLPWFARVVGEDEVRIEGGRQSVMDREIDYAADAGLDYWAFLLYPEDSSMSAALKQYLKSDRRERLSFCAIVHNTLGVSAERWPAERERFVRLLREPGYLAVLGHRPLVYAFAGRSFPFQRFAELQRAAREAGLKPYWVYMGWNPAADFRRVASHGFDAVSNYAKGGSQRTFEELARSVETSYWQAAAAAKVPYVPLVTTGWDKRPRIDHPVSWEREAAYHRQKVFPSQATPGEIAAHLRRALDFVQRQPEVCEANATLLYAWNEHDEGGWLSPTLGPDGQPDTSRLRAVAEVLRESPASRPGGPQRERPEESPR